jgi:citronellol/citronellal dehydrogenase
MRSFLVADANADQVCLVTGGGTGIGRAIALELARTGGRLAICGRRSEPLAETRDAIEQSGADCLDVACDVREPDQVSELVERVIERFGRIDVLVNNAGGQFTAPAEDITPNGFRAVHRLAVDAAWDVTRTVARRSMIPNRRGVILFIGFSPVVQAGYAHAASARAAIANLAQGLSLEWSRYRVRTVCIAVGSVATEGAAAAYGADTVAQWAASVPLGRLGHPDDIAGVAAFLASDAAAFVTGSTVYVDGGQAAWGAAQPPPTAPADAEGAA